jgi:hypothetical protein
MSKRVIITVVSSFVLFSGLFLAISTKPKITPHSIPKLVQPTAPVIPDKYNITTLSPKYLDYNEIISQLKVWNQEAPEITEIGSYGKTSNNNDICYIRIGKKTNAPKVLITACIHGNEKIANAVVMGIICKYLSDYGRDSAVTQLVNERDVYWVPVVSPDSFIDDQRHVDGVDPNRNFPYPGQPNVDSIPPINSLREFFLKHQFKAAISTHAYGRIYIYPYGYTNQPCPDHQTYRDICGRMATYAQYKSDQIRNVQTAPPYHGFEADWFYLNGALGMVAEVGIQFRPPVSDIQPEINRNYKSYLLFISEAPMVKLK